MGEDFRLALRDVEKPWNLLPFLVLVDLLSSFNFVVQFCRANMVQQSGAYGVSWVLMLSSSCGFRGSACGVEWVSGGVHGAFSAFPKHRNITDTADLAERVCIYIVVWSGFSENLVERRGGT
jgi:hypothetical protein